VLGIAVGVDLQSLDFKFRKKGTKGETGRGFVSEKESGRA